MHLVRLAYFSRCRLRELGLAFAKEIRAIEDACDRNNPTASLTGALAFNEQWFASVIEGDRARVSALMARIAADPRHGDMTLVHFAATAQRRFPDWALAYAGQWEAAELLYLRFGIVLGFDPSRMAPNALVGLVEGLSQLDGGGTEHVRRTAAETASRPAPARAEIAARTEPAGRAEPLAASMPRPAAVERTAPLPPKAGADVFRVQRPGPVPEAKR